ncbi:MAG: MinD/ParA family protein [Desulfobacterales bacterium]|nr:MinD/ParA family protein [Desulfobacterales bacterium]
MKRVITITSGKGGVGKTNICVNLAIQFAKIGLKTCIFDADLGLANINILMGIRPEYTLEDVVNGEKSIQEILIHDPCGVDIIPGGSGIEKLAAMTPEEISRLIDAFSCLDGYDILFFDTSAGISRDVLSFCMASQEVLLVVTPEPTSLTDGYSMLKVLSLNSYRNQVKLVMNKAKNERFARSVFNKFNETVKQYLPLEVKYIGCLPDDETVAAAVTRQQPFLTLYPSSRAAGGIDRLARFLIDHPHSSETAFEDFWEKYMEFAGTPLKLPKRKNKKKPEPLKTKTDIIEEPSNTCVESDINSAQEAALSGQILASLNQLTSIITGMSAELKEFRQALEEKTAEDPTPSIPGNDVGTPQLPPVISLDFDAYIEKKQEQLQ